MKPFLSVTYHIIVHMWRFDESESTVRRPLFELTMSNEVVIDHSAPLSHGVYI